MEAMTTYYIEKFPGDGGMISQRIVTEGSAPRGREEIMTQEQIDEWLRANEPTVPHRVSKDTMIERIKAAGKLAQARTIYAAQTVDDRFAFDQMAWCWNTNARMVGFVEALGLNPDDILAPDPWIS